MYRLRDRRGFTLLELMIVVVILAILAVVAIFSYKKYMRKARAQEAIAVLGDIKIKQAQFMASYGQYVSTSNSADNWSDAAGYYPSQNGAWGNDPLKWDVDCSAADPTTPGGAFCQLGVRPGAGEIWFQYKTVGWRPGDAEFSGVPPDDTIPNVAWRDAGSPMWWYATARTWWDPSDTRPQAAVVALTSVLLVEPVIKEALAPDFLDN